MSVTANVSMIGAIDSVLNGWWSETIEPFMAYHKIILFYEGTRALTLYPNFCFLRKRVQSTE